MVRLDLIQLHQLLGHLEMHLSGRSTKEEAETIRDVEAMIEREVRRIDRGGDIE